jgi:hypothetical protein
MFYNIVTILSLFLDFLKNIIVATTKIAIINPAKMIKLLFSESKPSCP